MSGGPRSRTIQKETNLFPRPFKDLPSSTDDQCNKMAKNTQPTVRPPSVPRVVTSLIVRVGESWNAGCLPHQPPKLAFGR